MASHHVLLKLSGFVLIHLLVITAQWAIEDDEDCKTPDQEVATCIEVSSCQHIVDVLEASPQPIPLKIKNLLRSYQCGFNSTNPKVCCPSKPIFVEGLTQTKNMPPSPRPNVSKHTDIGLLLEQDAETIANENKIEPSENPSVASRAKSTHEDCTGPNNQPGTCIVINTCQYITNILETAPKPITPRISYLLNSYVCGFNNRIPKVCCPSITKKSALPSLPASPQRYGTESPDSPPDVSNHRNIGLLPKECGILDTGERIVNGNKTGLFEYPWMALVFNRTWQGPNFRCGGTIINDKYILTAAHCIANFKRNLAGVRVGEHNIHSPIDCEWTKEHERICAPMFKDLTVEEIIVHPGYISRTRINDIGLLRVTRMDFSENIKPICLPLDKTRTYDFTNRMCVVTGWGATETGFSSAELLQVKIQAMSDEECVNIYKKYGIKINHRQLCAGGTDNKDSCSGDSGGPLQVLARLHRDTRIVQQGVVSFGPKFCGTTGFPGVYTRVAHYMDWILDNMRS